MTISRRIVLHFPKKLVDEPIIYLLSKNYNLIFNILKASVTPGEEGLLVFELTGKKSDYEAGVEYLKSLGVKIEPLSRDVKRNDLRCTQCSVCVTICPTGALSVDRKTMMVGFDSAKCTACELCVKACPPRAMEVRF